MFKPFAVTVSAIAFALFGTAAHAATVTANTSVVDLSGTLLSFSNDQFVSDASTPYQSGWDTSVTLQNYYFNNTFANGNASFANIDNSLAPLPLTRTGAINDGTGSATVLWSFDWIATGTGKASLDLQYVYSATVSNLNPGETGIAVSAASMQIDGTQNRQEALHYFNNEAGETSGIADLVLDFDVVAGQKGSIIVAVSSNSLAAPAVPVPAAAWLMGSALISLGGIVRRRAGSQSV